MAAARSEQGSHHNEDQTAPTCLLQRDGMM
jgi:hypothetical protein